MEALMSAIKASCQALGLALALLLSALARAEPVAPSDVIAIDVLIEPDATMISNAQAINARMRENYPQGYPLDQTHRPHITLMQAFVHGRDFARVTAAVSKAVRSSPALPLQLKATGYNVAEAAGLGVVEYSIERSLELAQLASRIVESVRPFVATTGAGPDAFAKVPGEQINGDTIEWVKDYATASTGDNYAPHLTLGTARADFADALKAKTFQAFTFTGVNVAIYRLGNFGTEQQRLWAFTQ